MLAESPLPRVGYSLLVRVKISDPNIILRVVSSHTKSSSLLNKSGKIHVFPFVSFIALILRLSKTHPVLRR